MRPTLFALLLTFALSAHAERQVLKSPLVSGLPLTKEALHKLEDPPRIKVTEQRRKLVKGDGTKCHDVACAAIVLPFILYEIMRAEEIDEVSVMQVQGTNLLYQGTFRLDGSLRSLEVVGPGKQYKSIYGLDLKELGKVAIVERYGSDTQGQVMTVQSQVDLLSEYRAAFQHTSGEGKRAALLNEAYRYLFDESAPLIREHLSSPDEADGMKASFLEPFCKDLQEHHTFVEIEPVGKLVLGALEALAAAPGPKSVEKATACLQFSRFPPGPTEALTGTLVRGVCTEHPQLDDMLGSLRRIVPKSLPRKAIEPEVERCDRPAGRAVLKACFGLAATEPEFAAAFTSSRREVRDRTWDCLEPDNPLHRPGYLAALRVEPSIHRMEALAKSKLPVQPEEVELIAQLYATADIGIGRPRLRATALELFQRAKGDTSAGRKLLQDALRRAEANTSKPAEGLFGAAEKLKAAVGLSGDEKPALRIALVLLGQKEEALQAARALGEKPSVPQNASWATDSGKLVAYGLKLAGCDEAGIQAAAREARSAAENARGRACVK